MNISEFVTFMNTKPAEFEAWWVQQHNENPEIYPLDLPKGDYSLWFEHFIFFMDSTNGQ